MKILSGIAILALGLSLASCGKKEASSSIAGENVAAVAAPAGTTWSATVNQNADGHFVMGNPDAKVKLVEFGSYTCSHCKDFSAEASDEIRALVDTGKMNFEFRPFLRDPIDLTTALLARCGGKDVFFPLSEQFFANQNAMFEKAQANQSQLATVDKVPSAQRPVQVAQILGLIDYAKQRGVSEDQAKQCLSDTASAEKLAKDVESASQQYKIQGTPSFLINGVLVDVTPTWKDVRAELRRAGV